MSGDPTPPPLVPIAEATGELELRKDSWTSGVHELVGPSGPVGRVDFSSWSGKARAETTEGTWGLSRVKGLTSSRIEVSDGETGEEVARMAKRTWTRGGTIELGGATYELRASGLLRPTWTWERDGRVLAEVDLTGSLGKHKGTVRATDEGRRDGHLALLLLLAVHVNASDDATTATTVAATS